MNMISTGAFLNEMDASNKQPTVAEKFAAVWEKKNAKAARAGGVSLMALSLAACGSSSTTTSTDTSTGSTTTTPVTPTGGNFDLTPLDDVASSTTAVNGSIASTFRFTTADDTVNAISASMGANDTLLDATATDNDVINITSTAAMTAITAVKIETANVTMASGSPTGVFTNFTGLTAVNVDGSVAGTITDAGTATITANDYTRILTIQEDLSGTTAASNPNTMNLAVSGATYGTTAATQTTLLIDNTDGGTDTVETLNVASNGSTANVFYLDASSDTDFSTINITGATAATVRLDHADVTGLTIAAGTNTADVDLSIDRNGATTTATNLLNMSGAETITLRDSTAGTDSANLTGVASGTHLILSTDFAGANIDMAGATRTAPAASLTIELDNSTAATDVDISGNLDVQDITALNIISNGNASTATAATVENAFTLIGDATSITLTGDTHVDAELNIDAAGASANTARAVVVDASGMTGTAYAELTAVASSLVSYTLTGTANNDTLEANAAGSTINGGAGNDTINGGSGVDTIDAGAGIDTVTSGAGADVITLGAGADNLVINALDVATAAETQTLTPVATGTPATAGTLVIKFYDGSTVTAAHDSNATITEVEAAITTAINGSALAQAGLVSATDAASKVTVTYSATLGNVDPITVTSQAVDATFGSSALIGTATHNITTTVTSSDGTTASDVQSRITDFDSSATGDVIQISVSGINALIGAVLDDADSTATSAGDTVTLIDYTVGSAFSDTDNTAQGQNVIKASYSSAINSAADFSTQLGSNTITLDAALASGNAMTAVFYDADSSQMVLTFLVHDAADAVLDGTTAVNEVARFDMTQTEYAAIDATDFAFIA